VSDIRDDEEEARRQQKMSAGHDAPAATGKAEAVEEILLKLSGGDADYGIEPRDGGFAFVKTVPPADDRLDYYGVPAREPLAWAPTLEAMQDRIILLDDAASVAVRAGAAEWNEETIRENPWTAVYLPTPDQTTDLAVLRKGLIAAGACAENADDELARGLAEARAAFLAETIMGRVEEAGIAAKVADGMAAPANQNERDAAAESREFSLESIARDPWSAVNDQIPQAPSDQLLEAARQAAGRCVDEAFGEFMASPVAEMRGMDQDYGGALDRVNVLEQIVATRELAREPMTVEAIEADPWSAMVRDLPADGSRQVYEAVVDALGELRAEPRGVWEGGLWPFAPSSEKEWADLNAAVESRIEDANQKISEIDARLDRTVVQEPLSAAAIAENPFNALHLEIPADADRELLTLTATTAGDLAVALREGHRATVEGEAVNLDEVPGYLHEVAARLPETLTAKEMSELGDKAAARQVEAGERAIQITDESTEQKPLSVDVGAAAAISPAKDVPAPDQVEVPVYSHEVAERLSESLNANEMLEAKTAADNILSPKFIFRAVRERLAWLAEFVLDTVIGYFVDEPKMTEQQIHDTLQARGNIDTIRAQEVAAAAQEDRVAYEYGALAAKSAQQEKDVYLSFTLGTPATAEANLGLDGYERQREEHRQEYEEPQEQRRGLHL
jgi:hypothetical protein